MAGAGADDMRGDEEPRPFDKAGIKRVAQIDRRQFRIDAAEVAQGREAVAHVFAGEAQPFERLGRGRLERLQGEVRGVHREVDMGVDEPGADCSLGKVDDLDIVGAAHRAAHLHDSTVAHKNLAWAREFFRGAVKHLAKHQR